MTKKTKLIQATEILKDQIPLIFTPDMLRKTSSKIRVGAGFSDGVMYRAQNSAKKIPLQWNKLVDPFKLQSFSDDVSILDILGAFCTLYDHFYLSHYSAMYFNEMIDQRPKDYFLTKEDATRAAQHSGNFNQEQVKLTFMKDARFTSYYFKFKKHKTYILEKQNLNQVGVISKKINHQDQSIVLRFTDVERTLIDSVISPHYAGGILTVVACFDKMKIDLKKLLKIYKQYSPFYPYWQSIGLILEKTKGKNVAKDWRDQFSNQIQPFFIAKGYRNSWKKSPDWQVYHPEGLF